MQIQNLDLIPDLLTVAKSSSVHSRRYILCPEGCLVPIPWRNFNLCLAQVPSLLWQLYTEPIFSGITHSLVRDVFLARRPDVLQDESVAEFVRRRWAGPVADNIVSAAVHGLCAGDIDSLSARSVMPICMLWDMEKAAERRRKAGKGLVGAGGVLLELFRGARGRTNERQMSTSSESIYGKTQRSCVEPLRDSAVGELQESLRGASVFSFRRGIGQLPDALERSLRRTKNVELEMGVVVTGIAQTKGGIDITVSKPRVGVPHATLPLPTIC